jgi:signal transduction histidine kinase
MFQQPHANIRFAQAHRVADDHAAVPVDQPDGFAQPFLLEAGKLHAQPRFHRFGVLDDIYQEGQRLRELVERLLVLARIDAGQPLALAPLDLEELVADVTERIAPRAHERGIELRALIGEAGPARGDATWLTQLLLNLLDNALRHTPSGGCVTLSLDAAPGGVVLRVADSGEGIPPEHLPHIFERFYRADLARTRAAGGAGLGLAICAWVAQAHGGRLTVESEVGRGTAFSLWLPAAPSASGSAAQQTEAVREAPGLSPAL